MSKTAKLIKSNLPNFSGNAALYETSDQGFVIVSAIDEYVTETYIFPADADGNVTDWGELDGSYKGGTSHRVALAGAGYTITN